MTANPGFRSRIRRYIPFPDYTPPELMQIFQQHASDAGYVLSEAAQKRAATVIQTAYENRGEGFGNGRWVRTIFERASLNLSDRLADKANITREHLMTLEASDMEDL